MDSLATMVECVLPRVSPTSARVVKALISSRGFVGRADAFAWAMGLRNRDQLRRILAADGLPCLEDLAGWIRILGWATEAEAGTLKLGRSALNARKDPRSYYRTVKRLTGRRWGEILVLGSTWVLLQFAARVGGSSEGRGSSTGAIQRDPKSIEPALAARPRSRAELHEQAV